MSMSSAAMDHLQSLRQHHLRGSENNPRISWATMHLGPLEPALQSQMDVNSLQRCHCCTGTLPEWGQAGGLPSFQFLDAENCSITGTLPSLWPASLPGLQTFQMDNNSLSGRRIIHSARLQAPCDST